MIIQALFEYYERMKINPDSEIAPFGFENKPLQFLIVIDEDGRFLNIEDIREKIGSRLIGKNFLLPRAKKRSGSKSYATTFLLWDHIGYLLGLPEDDKKSSNQHQAWLAMLKALPEELKQDRGVAAVISFYENEEYLKAINSPAIKECLKSVQCNMTFRLINDVPVPCRKAAREFVNVNGPDVDIITACDDSSKSSKQIGTCLITGEKGVIARTHGNTPINKDTKSLVSFQKNSGYDSYGKEQGYNAPIIKQTEFAYVTALNKLLKTPTQRMNIGDAVTVFWSAKESSFESDITSLFQEPEKDDPHAKSEIIQAVLQSVNSGTYLDDDGDTRFYILGLSPNSARISVRFWHVGTITEFATRIRQYFEEFKIIKPPNEPGYYSLWRILVNIATQDRSENIPPNLTGEFMRAILGGTLYPSAMLQAVLRRIRSDTKNRVKPIRAALIKACLNRYYKFYPNSNVKEVEFELDPNQPSIGYQLGRLFATLEKIQEEANPGLNATIRERYYGAACAMPVSVFPILTRLKNHHLAKLENKGRVINFERLLGEIISHLNDFPSHLDLHEQGRFAIGYYHQRQDFYKKKETSEDVVEQAV
jgi:CRISPR-associated protein Csd1